ncbi:hypothetical protein HHK36_032535 [Tetracentron sinense]|uniref:Uncharacterized protein n=1 Tax=Tetracentron sinense TaxID=13715 RepID=A0A835CZG2_TETSI|nr:hypothetical protein HHK36_032535 [Tetracentron sinense]
MKGTLTQTCLLPLLYFISYLNLTKENEVVVDVWLATMSVGGSHHMDLYYLHAIHDFLHLSMQNWKFSDGFTTYSKLPGRDVWPPIRSVDRVPGNPSTATGKFLPHLWQTGSENPPDNAFLQGSAGGAVFSSHGFTPGECFAGISDSGCALSLLSTQPWGSRSQASGHAVSNLMNDEGAPMAQSTAPHGAVTNHFTNNTWNFKGNEAGSSSHEMPHALGLGQVSQPANSQFSDELELGQQGGRQYIELGQSRAYGSSSQQMQWSL